MKPNKRQKAILSLLQIVKWQDMNADMSEELGVINDKELIDLIKSLVDVTEKIENKLEELEKEVLTFLDDDSDF